MARSRSLLLVLAVLVSACGTAPDPDSSPGARAPSTDQPVTWRAGDLEARVEKGALEVSGLRFDAGELRRFGWGTHAAADQSVSSGEVVTRLVDDDTARALDATSRWQRGERGFEQSWTFDSKPRGALAAAANPAILVSVTRIENPQKKQRKARRSAHWPLQDAKARFSELVRRATSEGPQHVTVHGRDQVVVIAADQYERLAGGRTGAELIAALQASPYPDIELEPQRLALPVREVKLT